MHNASELSAESPDEQLLSAFWSQRDEAAFAELVRRHGPMVLQAARRIAGNTQDAEDVFQATFLALARRARGVQRPGRLAAWLHEVATNLALNLRRAAARRAAMERRSADMAPAGASAPDSQIDDLVLADLLPVLDRELAALPTKYRVPIVLCDLEGQPRRAVAIELGLSDGVLSRLLDTGRQLLAARLQHQGVVVTVAVLALILAAQGQAAAAPTPALIAATAQAAAAEPGSALPLASERAAELARGVPTGGAAWLARIGLAALVLISLSGTVLLVRRATPAVEVVYERQVPTHEFAVTAPKVSRLDFRAFRAGVDGHTQDTLVLREAVVATGADGRVRARLTGELLPHGRLGMRVCLRVYDRSGKPIAESVQGVPAAAASLPPDRGWVPVTLEFDLGNKIGASDIARGSLAGWDGANR